MRGPPAGGSGDRVAGKADALSGGADRRPDHLYAIAEGTAGHVPGTDGGGVAEELLHLAGGRVGDEHAGGLADGDEGVGDVARTEDGVAGLQGEALIACLDENLAFNDIEPFLLSEMKVEWRAPAGTSLVCSMAKRLGVSAAEVLKRISL
jgi:hypothetical protein